MTKRVKLLSVMVAAVLCFVAGFALMFGSNKAQAEVVAAPTVDASSIAGKNFSSTSKFWVANKNATTSNWIILEWENDAGNTTERTGGGWTWGAVIGDETLNSSTGVGAPASNVWHEFGTYFFGTASAGKKVKITVNTETGEIAGYIDGALKESVTRPVDGLSNFKFRTGANDAYSCNATIYNFKAYDENGTDLGVETNMEEIVDLRALDSIDTTSIVAKSYGGSGTKTLFNATASESEWIIFEWTNGEKNDVTPAGGHMFSYGLATSKVSTELVSVTDRTQLLENEGTTKVAFETATGKIYRSFNGGAWSACPEGTVKSAADVGALYAGILWNNGNVVFAELFNLKCYDEDGNNLGVDTNFAELLVLPGTAVKPVVDNKYYANDGLNFASATATSAQYIIFEYTLKAGTGVTAGGNQAQNAFISTLSTDGTVTNDNIAGSADGFLYQYGTTPSVYSAYEWFIAGENDTAVKMVVDTQTGIIYVSKDGGVFNAFAAHGEAATLTGTDRYFGITTNAPGGSAITGYVEDLVCYDSNGVNLGIKTKGKFGEVVDGKVVDIVGNLGANEVGGGRYLGHIYFKDLEGNDIEGFCLGDVPALKYGVEATTLKFSAIGGAHQLFSPANNGKEGTVHNGWEWTDYDNEWYVVEAGTLVGGKVILAEDMIIRMHGSTMQLFNASHEFAITDGENEIATYTFNSNDTTALTTLPDGADGEFVGWFLNDSRVTTVMDVSNTQIIGEAVLTAKYATRVTLEETIAMGLGDAQWKRFQAGQSRFVFKAVADNSDVILNKRIGTISLLASGVQIDEILIDYGAETHLLNLSELGWVEGNALEVDLQWYVIPAETVLGNIILDEDIILRANGTECVLMPVDGVYNVTYEGLEGAENTNATTYSYGSPITLTDLADKAGYDFLGWFINGVEVETITFGEYVSDVVVTAKWAKADLTKYNATITASKNLTVNFYADIEGYEPADVKVYVNGSATPIVGVYDATRGLYKFSCEMAYADLTAITIELKVGDQVKDTATVNMITRLAEVASSDEDYAALIGSYIAYATATNTTAGSGNVPADAFVGQVAFGEIGIRDNANKWVAPATGDVELVFETAKTGTLQVEINGVKQDATVVDGEIVIDLSSFTNASNIGAKLTIKVFDGATQVGNTAVLNMSVVLGTEMSQVQSSAMALYVSLLFLA